MKKLVILLTILAVLPLSVWARSSSLSVKTTLGKDGERKTVLSIKTEKSTIEARYVSSPYHQSYDAYWSKSDVSGRKVCVKAHKQNRLSYGYYFEKDQDGGSVIVGYVNPLLSNTADAFLLMKSARGNSIWLHQSNTDPELSAFFNRELPLNDGSTPQQYSIDDSSSIDLEVRLRDVISERVSSMVNDLIR
ncbi:MAG: hypothetical protein NTW14_00375 [bacterium]|nr:hypothetical protein [bacterium]